MGLQQLLIDSEGGLQPNGNVFRQRSFGYGENAPLITTDLPRVTESTNSNPRLNLINDISSNFVRGGIQGVANRVITDARRLTKFAVTPQGLGFLASNVALQRTNPQNLTSSRNRTFSGFGTFASALTSFAGLRFRRDGLIDLSFESGYNNNPDKGGKKYESEMLSIAQNEETNSSYLEQKTSVQSDIQATIFSQLGPNHTIVGLYNNLLQYPNSSLLKEYGGGPHSVFGIGNTKITRYKSNPYGTEPYLPIGIPFINGSTTGKTDFRSIKKTTTTNSGEVVNLPSYPFKFASVQRYETGDGRSSYGFREQHLSPNENGFTHYVQRDQHIDRVNAANIFKRSNIRDVKLFRDYIKFRIAVVDTDNPMNDNVILFRAFLDNINDNYTGDWNSHKYNGRAENFYVYNGFDRQIQFNFKIHSSTRAEMKPLWRKLNYLVAQTAPEYKATRMRGVFSRLTIGDWFCELPGFFTNINLTWNPSYPWEVRTDRELSDIDMNEYPHVLDVSCTFKPVHNFTPSNDATTPFILPDCDVIESRKWHKPTPGELISEEASTIIYSGEYDSYTGIYRTNVPPLLPTPTIEETTDSNISLNDLNLNNVPSITQGGGAPPPLDDVFSEEEGGVFSGIREKADTIKETIGTALDNILPNRNR